MPSRTINGNEIYYEESGQGTPLVLLHGFPLDSRIWLQQRAALSSRFRVITPDLRGFGRSPSVMPFTLAQLADDIHALLAGLGALPCIFGGLSMGGYVSLEFAKKYAADLRGFLLIDTKAEADTPEGKQGREKMIQLVREKGSIAVAAAMMPKMVAPHAQENRPSMVRDLREIMEHCPPLTIEHALMAMRDRRDHAGNLASIAVPTLIVVGEMDAITPPMVAEAMHGAIRNSLLMVIKGAGHMAPMEQPEQVNKAILHFIEEMRIT